ncbi:Biotin synthase, mitochondrial [Hondaea fermentalgiana]|uniref:biotin synthase n=1 Tax=Hondaea fermentalgiana TaxID=2315210 RepID=A0A2R5GA87_9STRA|nr:Biotin synthase, mitochondrial [Hondaea fermentalgiana]|eukprot:GBG27936.1 Biotin synthase, mitochondrial [Hondaea fermentalgiana]
MASAAAISNADKDALLKRIEELEDDKAKLQAELKGDDLRVRGVNGRVRTDWTKEEIQAVYEKPLIDLVFDAAMIHRLYFSSREIMRSTLISYKSGGCSENCGYCSQSQHHKTFVKPTPAMQIEEVLEAARRAKAAGSARFCMGSAWRSVGKKHAFKRILELVKEINGMGMEVCTTLGMLTPEQAKQLKEAGLTAYNHNLDTSREYYPKVVTTRSYDDRLDTVKNVREAGISVCCGGIVGLGEEEDDRVGLLHQLATLTEHPESVPINALVPVAGTPLGDKLIAEGKAPQWDEMVRMIATARIVMPRSMVRLSAGRMEFPMAAQGLMFMAGANSIFTGDKLLTTPNPAFSEDDRMFEILGLVGKAPHTAPLKSPYSADDDVADAADAARAAQPGPRFVDIQVNKSSSKLETSL